MYERERKIDGIRTAPLVSVIMPAYNAEKYIEEAVSSVLSQTYKNWELLILDDCSSDCTAEIAEYFASLDTRIRLLRNPQNMGVAKTRNRGFDIAKGEWIALLDSDDVWHSDKLEKQLLQGVLVRISSTAPTRWLMKAERIYRTISFRKRHRMMPC